MCRAAAVWLLLPGLCVHLSPTTLMAEANRPTPTTPNPASSRNPTGSSRLVRTNNVADWTNRAVQIPLPKRESAPRTQNERQRRSAKNPLWSTVGSLVLVILLILIIARLWKKNGPAIGSTIPAEAVEMLGKKRIDQRQTIYLVRLGSRILVLGSSLNGLQTLAEISDPVEADLMAGLCRQTNNDHGVVETFRSLFQKVSTVQTNAPTEPQSGISASVNPRFAERIRQESTEPLEGVHG